MIIFKNISKFLKIISREITGTNEDILFLRSTKNCLYLKFVIRFPIFTYKKKFNFFSKKRIRERNYVYFIIILYNIVIYFNRIRYINLFVLCGTVLYCCTGSQNLSVAKLRRITSLILCVSYSLWFLSHQINLFTISTHVPLSSRDA